MQKKTVRATALLADTNSKCLCKAIFFKVKYSNLHVFASRVNIFHTQTLFLFDISVLSARLAVQKGNYQIFSAPFLTHHHILIITAPAALMVDRHGLLKIQSVLW